MKPRSFTYNQIHKLFLEGKCPLTPEQRAFLATKVKEEIAALEADRAKKKAKADKRFLERTKASLGYSRIGLNNV